MKQNLLFLFLILGVIYVMPGNIIAVNCEDKPTTTDQNELITFWSDVTKACNDKISSLDNQKATLQQAITTLNSKINLAQAQINQTQVQINVLEKEVTVLSGVLETVNQSMDDLSKIYLARVRESYRRSRITPIDMIFSTESFGDFLTKMKYLNTIKAKDQLILKELENSRLDYDQRKTEKVDKQKEVEKLKAKLISQKKILDILQKDQQNRLVQTQNDEKKYAALLSEAAAEVNALLTSKFSEKRDVKKGDVIGIMGNTGNSRGAHLHFGVYNLKENEKLDYYHSLNPLEYLASKSVLVDDDACDDVRNGAVTKNIGNGNHDWPFGDIRITQCWGHTPYSSYYPNNIHDGVDMVDSSLTVRAVDDGVAYVYRGSTAMGNNVRIFHSDGKMTLYLHLK